jgi:hypothetical protein
MSHACPFLRPLLEREIETVRTIEKRARIRYRNLAGISSKQPKLRPLRLGGSRYAIRETIVAELCGKLPASWSCSLSTDCFMSPTFRSAGTLLDWGWGSRRRATSARIGDESTKACKHQQLCIGSFGPKSRGSKNPRGERLKMHKMFNDRGLRGARWSNKINVQVGRETHGTALYI